MATENNLFDITCSTIVDQRSNQYTLQSFQGSKIVTRCSDVSALAIGILQNNPASGQEAVVRCLGVSKALAGGTITAAGNKIGPETFGSAVVKANATDSGDVVIGVAMESAVSGQIFSVLMMGREQLTA
jgi:hypothetical protein